MTVREDFSLYPLDTTMWSSDSPYARRFNNVTKEETVSAQPEQVPVNSSKDTEGLALTVPGINMSEYIAELLSEEPIVECVYGKWERDAFYIMTFIKTLDRQARRRIYSKQQDIMNRFPKFTFDFYVIALDGNDVSSLISGVKCIFRRS